MSGFELVVSIETSPDADNVILILINSIDKR